MNKLRKVLSGGDLRSIGLANEVADGIKNQKDFDRLFALLSDQDRLVAMRAADAVEKITKFYPHFLDKHKKETFRLMLEAANKELTWHIVLLLPRLSLNKAETQTAWSYLLHLLRDKNESKIVRVNSLQALHEMNQKSPVRAKDLTAVKKLLEKENNPSILARLRKLNAANQHPL